MLSAIPRPMQDATVERDGTSEIKFLVPPALIEPVRTWVRARLQPDPNGGGVHADEYQTTSLYFDTPEFHTIGQRGSYARRKFRVRRYGISDIVFLERKLKSRGLITKRRSIVPIGALDYLASPSSDVPQ